MVVSGERRCSLGVAPLLSGETCRARSVFSPAFWEAEVNAPPSHHPSLTFSPVRFYQHYQLHHHTYIHIKKHITVFFLVWLVLLLENLLASRSLGGGIGAHSWFSDFSG